MLTKLRHSAIDGVSGIEMLGAPARSVTIPPARNPTIGSHTTSAGQDPSDVELLAHEANHTVPPALFTRTARMISRPPPTD